MTNTNNTKNNHNIQKSGGGKETKNGILNNSIRFLAYDYPVDLKQEWVEFRFEDQGNGTAKLRPYSNGRFIKQEDIKPKLALYYATYIRNNRSGVNYAANFVRGQSIRGLADSFERITFTYNADTFQAFVHGLIMPPSPVFLKDEKLFQDEKWAEDQGLVGVKIEGHIYSNFANTDFNQYIRFSATRELYRFVIREDGLYAEYTKQVRISDGEYYLNTHENANNVLTCDYISYFSGVIAAYNHNDNRYQKIKLIYDNIHNAYTIGLPYVDSTDRYCLKCDGTDILNVRFGFSNPYYYGYWYLQDVGNGRHRLINAYDEEKSLSWNKNTNRVDMQKSSSALNQHFVFIKSTIQDLTNGEWSIASKINNNKILDVNNNASTNNVTIWDKLTGNNQKWVFKGTSLPGIYKIESKIQQANYFNKYVLVCNYTTNNIIAREAIDSTSEYWFLDVQDDGSYIIRHDNNKNMVLDLYGSNTTNGTNVQIHAYHGADNQKWRFIKL